MICVNCGKDATKGSMKHPYCEKCWDMLWKGKEDQYYDWLPYHNTIVGGLWYKRDILREKLSFIERLYMRFESLSERRSQNNG